ncbi:MAG: hypothetical protein FWG81_07690 [Betaproteobacteria bacterium]|nr:hypothetical protein [Betaproteobacteria bacterium]
MKTAIVIRFTLAALFGTIACIGLCFNVAVLYVLWVVPYLLLAGRSELTKPIMRSSWKWLFLLIGILIMLPFLHLPTPNQTVRTVISIPMWFLFMWVIYRLWQKEKGQADA